MKETLNLKSTYPYTQNRELSWLQFNQRVLEEAENPNVPLIERLNFTNIFTSNLDEFYMVRVGKLHTQTEDLNHTYIDNKTGWTPQQELENIYNETRRLYIEKDIIYHNVILELKEKGINNLKLNDLNPEEEKYLHNYFKDFILPQLKPYIIDSNHPFPELENLALNLFVKIENQTESHFGVVKIPKSLPKLIYIYNDSKTIRLSPIENLKKPKFIQTQKIILKYANEIFNEHTVTHKTIIRITRKDIDIARINLPHNEDYLEYIEKQTKLRPYLTPVRLEIYRNGNPTIKRMLSYYLNLNYNQIFVIKSPLDTSFIEEVIKKIDKKEFKDLLYTPYAPQLTNQLTNKPIIPQIKKKDVLIFYPYETTDTFLRLLNEAANDPKVTSIKISLYRISKESKVIEMLLKALKQGKEVTVLIELRARFDEENNIQYTKILKENGCNILYGFEHYKVHSKICLITRKERGKLTYTTQIGTGNYNEVTSKIYSDFCYITSNQSICEDAILFFNNMEEKKLGGEYQKFLVSPCKLQKDIINYINYTIELVHNGENAIIIMKMNGLTDINIINALEKASNAGVKIKLIIRGICTLIPGVKGHTENITIISIVGRFLEHTRIYCFGREIESYSKLPPENLLNMYISSADLMTRNTEERVEVAVPIQDPKIKKEIYDILDFMLHDNVKAYRLNSFSTYEKNDNELMVNNAQDEFMKIAIKNKYVEKESRFSIIFYSIKEFFSRIFKF